jgi:integrase/recombinase XerD
MPALFPLVVVKHHNMRMSQILKFGTMKNYFTTERYLGLVLKKHFRIADIPLKALNYEFIAEFEFFVRANALKRNDPCTTNGTMKHCERLKKMVSWAVKNEWIEKDPFSNFKLKFKHKERDYLNELELGVIETQEFENPILRKVRDLFVFSCYTGLSYIDLMGLKEKQILTGIDNMKWIKTSRAKTDIAVNVPLLKPAELIMVKYANRERNQVREWCAFAGWLSCSE